jgi:hypothetical protein
VQVDQALGQLEREHLARLQRSLRLLGGGEGVSGGAAGRGVRLHLARLAVEERLRADREARTQRRADEFQQALAALMERVNRRALATPRLLALPAPVVPSTAAAPRPAAVRRAGATAKPRSDRRHRPPPPPEFWSPRPVLGFRMWEMRGRLHGAWRAWDRPVYRAQCVSGREEKDDGQVPHTDGRCGTPPCGLYAFKEPEQLLAAFGLPAGSVRWVMGLVALTGKVVEHERGYRGQQGQVVAAAVVGRGLLVRVEGPARLQSLFDQPEATVARLINSDPGVAEEVGGRAAEAVAAYLTLARDFYEMVEA